MMKLRLSNKMLCPLLMTLVHRCGGYRFDLELCNQEFQALDKDGTGRLRPEDLSLLYEVRFKLISLLSIRSSSYRTSIFLVAENGFQLSKTIRTG